MPARPWLSVEQVAAALDTHPEVVRRWLLQGRLSGVKVGRAWHVAPEALPQTPSPDMPDCATFPTIAICSDWIARRASLRNVLLKSRGGPHLSPPSPRRFF